MQYRKSTMQIFKVHLVVLLGLVRQLFNICNRLLTGMLMIQRSIYPVVVNFRNHAGSLYTCIMCSENLVVKEVV